MTTYEHSFLKELILKINEVDFIGLGYYYTWHLSGFLYLVPQYANYII